MQVKGSDYCNEAAPWIMEYAARTRLAKLGYTETFDDLDCLTAEAMLIIDYEYESAKAEEMLKSMKKPKR